jgi:Homeodomain-like domain
MVLDRPPEEQTAMLAALRRGRYGGMLALHIVLLCAAGRTSPDIAAVLFCARSSVYRTVHAYREGNLALEYDDLGRRAPPVHTTVLMPALRRSLRAVLQAAPQAYGWYRARGSAVPRWP